MAAGDRYKYATMWHGEDVGIASALEIPISFRPAKIEVVNKTTNTIYWWAPPHGAAGATKAVDSGAGTTDISTVTSNGITVGDSSFTLGTGVQTTSDVIFWTAFR